MVLGRKRKKSQTKGIAHDIKRGVKKIGRGAQETMEKAKDETNDIWENIKG